jgi:hypothetical protein
MDLLTIGIVVAAAWFAVAAVVLAVVTLAGRADRQEERLTVAAATEAQWAFSDARRTRARARRTRKEHAAAAEHRMRTGMRTAIH